MKRGTWKEGEPKRNPQGHTRAKARKRARTHGSNMELNGTWSGVAGAETAGLWTARTRCAARGVRNLLWACCLVLALS